MIHPDMATLLVFLFTRCRGQPPQVLKKLLRQALPVSFNRITMDGDTSTNDTILLLASGRAGNAPITADVPRPRRMGAALNQVMGDLAQQVVADGEGATPVFKGGGEGRGLAPRGQEGRHAVALSPLVKTAMAGADVNWGRIMAALGRSGAASTLAGWRSPSGRTTWWPKRPG